MLFFPGIRIFLNSLLHIVRTKSIVLRSCKIIILHFSFSYIRRIYKCIRSRIKWKGNELACFRAEICANSELIWRILIALRSSLTPIHARTARFLLVSKDSHEKCSQMRPFQAQFLRNQHQITGRLSYAAALPKVATTSACWSKLWSTIKKLYTSGGPSRPRWHCILQSQAQKCIAY